MKELNHLFAFHASKPAFAGGPLSILPHLSPLPTLPISLLLSIWRFIVSSAAAGVSFSGTSAVHRLAVQNAPDCVRAINATLCPTLWSMAVVIAHVPR